MANTMKVIKIGLFLIAFVNIVYCQVSGLDKLIGPFRSIRRYLAVGADKELRSPRNNNFLQRADKLQRSFDETVNFPCNLKGTRSENRPTSVHKLRPGDIDVIGALGDSLTAGFGAFATKLNHLVLESRGVSFIMGGDGTWRQYLTLANIFKAFNPNIIGYSTGNCISTDRCSKFNVAEGGAVSDNLPYMAKVLVKRILNDPNVDVINDWKFINILIGSNDFCSEICYADVPEKLIQKHRQDMIDALRILRDHLPRALVNIIPALHPGILRRIKSKTNTCHITHPTFCPCLFGIVPRQKLEVYNQLLIRWQEEDLKLSTIEEFNRNDFAVISQPLTINMTPPMKQDSVDLSYFSVDCFHMSQKGNAALANNIWNSLLVPVGQKSNVFNYDLLEEFNCPSDERPYIFTDANSLN